MDPTIIAAIIGGVAVIIAAVIQRGASNRRDGYVNKPDPNQADSTHSNSADIEKPKKRWILAIFVLLSFAVGGWTVGYFTYQETRDNPTALIFASVVWVFGLYATYRTWKN